MKTGLVGVNIFRSCVFTSCFVAKGQYLKTIEAFPPQLSWILFNNFKENWNMMLKSSTGK